MQKTNGTVIGRVAIPSIKEANKDRFLECLSPTIIIKNVEFSKAEGNQNTLTFDFKYGPVAGGWRSDVSAKIKAALVKAGSHASPTFIHCKRIASERVI